MVKVSVIVPVYNGEQYISRCMSCLVNQTLKDIEIIVIDDCSKDNSRQLLLDWVQKFPDKIKLVSSQVNRGAGGARNLGLAYSTGEYVGYMDCDDLVAEDMYQKLYDKAIEENAQIVDCGYYDEKNNKAMAPWEISHTGLLDDAKRSELICGVGYSVTKIFLRSFLLETGVIIREGVIYEDLDYLIKLILMAQKVGVVYEVLYQYTDNPSSSSNSKAEQKKFLDMVAVIEECAKSTESKVKEAMDYVVINCCVAAIGQCLFNQENPEFTLVDNLKKLKEITREYFVLGWQKNPYLTGRMDQDNIELVEWFVELKI